jgi:ferritin-like metal-binding protein YciE
VNRDVLAHAQMPDPAERVVLNMDSSESPLHGKQEGGAYASEHFETACYHLLFLFNDHGDC